MHFYLMASMGYVALCRTRIARVLGSPEAHCLVRFFRMTAKNLVRSLNHCNSSWLLLYIFLLFLPTASCQVGSIKYQSMYGTLPIRMLLSESEDLVLEKGFQSVMELRVYYKQTFSLKAISAASSAKKFNCSDYIYLFQLGDLEVNDCWLTSKTSIICLDSNRIPGIYEEWNFNGRRVCVGKPERFIANVGSWDNSFVSDPIPPIVNEGSNSMGKVVQSLPYWQELSTYVVYFFSFVCVIVGFYMFCNERKAPLKGFKRESRTGPYYDKEGEFIVEKPLNAFSRAIDWFKIFLKSKKDFKTAMVESEVSLLRAELAAIRKERNKPRRVVSKKRFLKSTPGKVIQAKIDEIEIEASPIVIDKSEVSSVQSGSVTDGVEADEQDDDVEESGSEDAEGEVKILGRSYMVKHSLLSQPKPFETLLNDSMEIDDGEDPDWYEYDEIDKTRENVDFVRFVRNLHFIRCVRWIKYHQKDGKWSDEEEMEDLRQKLSLENKYIGSFPQAALFAYVEDESLPYPNPWNYFERRNKAFDESNFDRLQARVALVREPMISGGSEQDNLVFARDLILSVASLIDRRQNGKVHSSIMGSALKINELLQL